MQLLIQTVTQMKSTYVIPGNDDAIRAVKLLTSRMADAIIEGRQGEAGEAEVAEEATAEDAE